MPSSPEKVIVVRAFPRVHVSLLDLADATPRRYGGAGFVLDCLPVEVHASLGASDTDGDDLGGLDARGRRDLEEALARLRATRDLGHARVAIRQLMPEHIGLGSKTATVLAALRACSAVAGWKVPRDTLQRLSGRGGASGVGVHGFFSGGFVVDGGHDVPASKGYLPSSSGRPDRVPPLCARLRVPSRWRFHLFLPSGKRVSGSDEEQFFLKNTPIPIQEAHSAIGSMYHGVIPAVAEGSIAALRDSLRSIHRSGFKSRELMAQPASVRALYLALSERDDVAVGMSSMGPLIYAICDSSKAETEAAIGCIATINGAQRLAVASARNIGCELTVRDAD